MTEISLATGPNREPFFNYNSREDGRHQFVGCVVDYGGGHGDGIEEIIADAGAWIAPEDLGRVFKIKKIEQEEGKVRQRNYQDAPIT
jgi:hypothetical protein